MLHDIAQILKAVAWPFVVLLTFLMFRSQVRSIFAALATKIERANRIKLTRSGLELAEEITRNSILAGAAPTRDVIADPEAEFQALVREYDGLDIKDLSARVVRRRELADRLGRLVVDRGKSRKDLAAASREGEFVALATAVILDAKASDLAHLEAVAEKANFNFTRYRIVLALPPALKRQRSPARNLDRVLDVLDKVEHRPDVATDASLQRLIDRTRAAILE